MLKINGVEYLSEKQISKEYGFSQPYFWKIRKNKKGPRYYKMSGRFFYTKEDVDKWFKENLKPSEI